MQDKKLDSFVGKSPFFDRIVIMGYKGVSLFCTYVEIWISYNIRGNRSLQNYDDKELLRV